MRNTFTGEGEILCFDAEDTQFYTLKKENFYDLRGSYKKFGVLGLGIYSEHSAVLLSNLIKYAFENFNTENQFRLFYKLDLAIVINCFGEVRADSYLHWWSFLSAYMEIDNKTLFSNILSIRIKKSKGKKLEKWEQEFYRENKSLIDLKRKLTAEEEEEERLLEEMFG